MLSDVDTARLETATELLIALRKKSKALEAWEIFSDDMTIAHEIGSGKFGEVYEGE